MASIGSSLPNTKSRIHLCECTMLRVTPRHLTPFEASRRPSQFFFDVQLYSPQLGHTFVCIRLAPSLDLTLHLGWILSSTT